LRDTDCTVVLASPVEKDPMVMKRSGFFEAVCLQSGPKKKLTKDTLLDLLSTHGIDAQSVANVDLDRGGPQYVHFQLVECDKVE
jgi:hypothetical protein